MAADTHRRPARRIPAEKLAAAAAKAAAKKKPASRKQGGPNHFKIEDTTQRQIFVPNELYDDLKVHKVALDKGRKHPISLHDMVLACLRLGAYVMQHNLPEAIEALGGMPEDTARARITHLLPSPAGAE